MSLGLLVRLWLGKTRARHRTWLYTFRHRDYKNPLYCPTWHYFICSVFCSISLTSRLHECPFFRN